MPKRGYSAEQIIGMLREAEVLNAQGESIEQISRGLGVTPTTFYRWRKEYGGLKISQAKRLKELEKENTRLRKAVSDLSLDKVILKEALSGKY
jgi:transposase-like protein